jgi:hypothetical protein
MLGSGCLDFGQVIHNTEDLAPLQDDNQARMHSHKCQEVEKLSKKLATLNSPFTIAISLIKICCAALVAAL